jgi:hypothetical protein
MRAQNVRPREVVERFVRRIEGRLVSDRMAAKG